VLTARCGNVLRETLRVADGFAEIGDAFIKLSR
jgi:hypothetical protein